MHKKHGKYGKHSAIDKHDAQAGRYVIQRASETLCEWWTSTGWSENDKNAIRFVDEPDVGKETGDESAKAQLLVSSNIVD
jgi:hypothetical protein